MFSCCMGPNEADTALSIVDPVTINIELKSNPTHMIHGRVTSGLLDVMDVHKSLEVSILDVFSCCMDLMLIQDMGNI